MIIATQEEFDEQKRRLMEQPGDDLAEALLWLGVENAAANAAVEGLTATPAEAGEYFRLRLEALRQHDHAANRDVTAFSQQTCLLLTSGGVGSSLLTILVVC